MSTDALLQVALAAALWGTGLAAGLRHGLDGLRGALRRRSLLVRVGVADVLLLPPAVWVIVRILDVPDGQATGLLLVGAASAGALGIAAAHAARADVPAAVVLVAVLELVNLVAIPVWAIVLLPETAALDVAPVVRILVLFVLLPLLAGAALRRARTPAWFGPACARVAVAGLVAAVVLAVAEDRDALLDADAALVPLAALAAVAVALALGWVAGGREPDVRWTAMLVTGIRANGPALAIATDAFAGRSDVRAGVVTFALCSIAVTSVMALARRSASARLPRGPRTAPDDRAVERA